MFRLRFSAPSPRAADPLVVMLRTIDIDNRMTEIIDLSQEIYSGMPVFNGLPEVQISVHATHEQWDKIPNPTTITPSVYKLELGENIQGLT